MKIFKILLLSSSFFLVACGGDSGSGTVNESPSTDNAAPSVDENENATNENDDTTPNTDENNSSGDSSSTNDESSNTNTPNTDENSSSDDSSSNNDETPNDDTANSDASNGDDQTANDDTTELNPDIDIDSTTPSGVYIYRNSPVSLLIDLQRQTFPIIGMDWSEEVFYIIDSATLNGNKITGKGFTGFRFNQETDNFIGTRSDDKETEIMLSDDRVSITVGIENQEFGNRIYSYDFSTKVAALELENIVGSHLSADGSLIEINDSGMITITASADANFCIFEGMIEKFDFYYDIKNLSASNCDGDPAFNGNYFQGRLITAKDAEGQNFILTMAIKSKLQLAWVSAQVNE